MSDWKDQLSSLLPDMPQVEVPDNTIEQPVRKQLPLLRVEKDKRKGKTATLITGHNGMEAEVSALAKQLKTRMAVGGSTRDGEILLQGDVRQKAAVLLQEWGYKTKVID